MHSQPSLETSSRCHMLSDSHVPQTSQTLSHLIVVRTSERAVSYAETNV